MIHILIMNHIITPIKQGTKSRKVKWLPGTTELKEEREWHLFPDSPI